MEKTLKLTAKYIQYIFTAMLAVSLLLGVVFRGLYKHQWYITVGICLFVPLLVWAYAKCERKFHGISEKKATLVFGILCVFVLALQIISAMFLTTDYPRQSDLNLVDRAAQLLAEDFDPAVLHGASLPFEVYKGTDFNQDIWKYFQVYPYQTPTLLLLTGLYKLGISPIYFNLVCLYTSYIFIYLTAKKLCSDNFRPLSVAVLAAIFPLFYTYIPIYYTDTLSMPFTILCVYFIVSAVHLLKNKIFSSDKAKIKILIYILFAATAVTLGFFIKASVAIILPAFAIYLLFAKLKWRNKLRIGGVFFGCFMVLSIVINTAVSSTGIYTKESREEYEFPKTHWVMMGIKDYGGYFSSDFAKTYSAGNYEQKASVNLGEIGQRIGDYNPLTFTKHVGVKIARTWGDGAYFVNNGYLESDFVNGKVFNVYANVVNMFLMVWVIWGMYDGARRGDFGLMFMLRVAICGVMLFFIIWETRSRYLINFVPLLLVLSTRCKVDHFATHKN